MAGFEVVALRAFTDNYIWTLRDSRCAAVVDPGDARPVLEYLRAQGLELVAILNTHHHADHVGGNAALVRHARVPVYGPDDDRIAELTHRLREGECIGLPQLGVELEVLEIPGHTRTHIAFYGAGMLFCGDTLFGAGCGRLFEGTAREMYRSLERLARLPAETLVYCGHEYTVANLRFARAAEPENVAIAERAARARRARERGEPTLPSTIAEERATNPFLRAAVPAVAASAARHAGRMLSEPESVFAVLREWKNHF